jgi:hypothetical protein
MLLVIGFAGLLIGSWYKREYALTPFWEPYAGSLLVYGAVYFAKSLLLASALVISRKMQLQNPASKAEEPPISSGTMAREKKVKPN